MKNLFINFKCSFLFLFEREVSFLIFIKFVYFKIKFYINNKPRTVKVFSRIPQNKTKNSNKILSDIVF